MMDMGYPLHLIDLPAKLYRKQLAKVKVAGTLSEWFRVKSPIRLNPFSVPVQHPSGDGVTTGPDTPKEVRPTQKVWCLIFSTVNQLSQKMYSTHLYQIFFTWCSFSQNRKPALPIP